MGLVQIQEPRQDALVVKTVSTRQSACIPRSGGDSADWARFFQTSDSLQEAAALWVVFRIEDVRLLQWRDAVFCLLKPVELLFCVTDCTRISLEKNPYLFALSIATRTGFGSY